MAHVVLCSTDTTMPAEQIRALYSARFQLEFVFRDAKQYGGLSIGQLRSRQGVEQHWNASFFSLSLAQAALVPAEAGRTGRPASRLVFSVEDAKRRAFNALFAQRILVILGLSQRFSELQNHFSRLFDLSVKAAEDCPDHCSVKFPYIPCLGVEKAPIAGEYRQGDPQEE